MCQNKERDTSEEQENDNLFLHKNSEQEEEDDYGDDFTLHKSLDLWIIVNSCDSPRPRRMLWGKFWEKNTPPIPPPPPPPSSQFALRKACTQLSANSVMASKKMQKAY